MPLYNWQGVNGEKNLGKKIEHHLTAWKKSD